MEHILDLSNVTEKMIVPLSDKFYGKDPAGNEISFTNYYMEYNKKPFFGISGECHFSRVHEDQWEDTILQMKMGGVNIIATYLFWIHHEEIEGEFCFEGRRNIRRFLELCKKHGMYVIVRMGPFAHGEARNGGFPDWLYGKPFESRSLNEGFLFHVRRWYQNLAKQFEDLYFKDGGPIIAAQIDNEYMHCGAPWANTFGISNEWVFEGNDGADYLLTLKKIAQEEGIKTPFYTCTGWGGAPTPTDELLPLYGGYAYWPWIFYKEKGIHPATDGYRYTDYHKNEPGRMYGCKPAYEPESVPFACCEMGGGMFCAYYYRFQLDYESVDGMANIKMGSGCNFLGYYVYRGGSNPVGKTGIYLNEDSCPKISYDYQAVLGEYGQVRPSYHRLRAIHLFVKNFPEPFLKTAVVVPEEMKDIKPENVTDLRYAIRTDGSSGFVFLNNYQDHVECQPKKDETIRLQLKDEEIVISGISMAAGEEAILPFKMDVEGYCLSYAKAQPLSVLRENGRTVYFFFAPEGMTPEYVWENKGITAVDGKEITGTHTTVKVPADQMSSHILDGQHGKVEIVTLTRAQSYQFYELEKNGRKMAVLSDCPVIFDGEELRVENPANENLAAKFLTYPARELSVGEEIGRAEMIQEGIFSGISYEWKPQLVKGEDLIPAKCGNDRYVIEIPDTYEDCKDAMLEIDYIGDIGQAFQKGNMIADNFCNLAIWEIGIKEAMKPELGNQMTILITPQKDNVQIDKSTMAGQKEILDGKLAELRNIHLRPVRETRITISEK